MSINGISGITGFGALGPADRSALFGAGAGAAAAAAQPASDDTAQQAAPARFPWLSRLSRELESAAQQPATFSAAPELGDHLDRSA
jgi:hypothetical protein